MPPKEDPVKPTIAQWILDTRSWFPEATQTKHLETCASRALSLLPPATLPSILRYYHLRDAKMALASALLKHYAVSKLSPMPTPWSRTVRVGFTRDARTKPVYADPDMGGGEGGGRDVWFNVSHQAGIVAIVAVAGYHDQSPGKEGKGEGEEGKGVVEVGVDVVCTSERRARDHETINSKDGNGGGGGDGGGGWNGFVDMHAEVFSPGEVSYLKHRVLSAVPGLLPPSPTVEQVADAKLRAFYALWALREAYVKLTGEALLAKWLPELEFRNFRPPKPTKGWDVPAREEEGEVVTDIEIWFRGKRVEDVNMCLRSMGQDYMIATAVRTPGRKEDGLGWELRAYEVLELEEVLDFAEKSG
ncbi:hypothetical protein VTI74DRAFT_2484 [Chaetomium olivicolor]